MGVRAIRRRRVEHLFAAPMTSFLLRLSHFDAPARRPPRTDSAPAWLPQRKPGRETRAVTGNLPDSSIMGARRAGPQPEARQAALLALSLTREGPGFHR